MLRLGTDRDQLSIVGDQIGCPTDAQYICKSVASRLSFLDLTDSSSGISDHCGDEQFCWYEYRHAIFVDGDIRVCKKPSNVSSITRISTRTAQLDLPIWYYI